MRLRLALLLGIFSAITHATSSVSADGLLAFEKSFAIPGPVSSTGRHVFADVDGDGSKDFVVWDANVVEMYSIKGDSIIATISIDSNFTGRLICADVNRDRMADLVIVFLTVTGSQVYSLQIRLYDGASHFSTIKEDTIVTALAGYYGPGLIGALCAYDINHDGYGELLISVDSTVERFWSMDYDADWREAGHTYCYFNFPDSQTWRSGNYFTQIDSVCFLPYQAHYVGRWYDYFQCADAPGVPDIDVSWSGSILDEILPDGSLHTLVNSFASGSCNVSHLSYSNHNRILCWGDMDWDQNSIELLVDYQSRLSGYPLCGYYRDSLVMYKIGDPMVKLWSRDRGSVPAYGNYVFHTDYSTGFLATRDNYLVVFEGSTGAPLDSSASLPVGSKGWENAADDGRPRFVALSGMTVSLYTFNLPTTADAPDVSTLPTSFQIRPVYPNPFNPSTTVSFDLPTRQRATITVYDVTGRIVRVLADQLFAPGTNRVVWNGVGPDGVQVSSGVYFFRLVTSDFDKSVKGVLIK